MWMSIVLLVQTASPIYLFVMKIQLLLAQTLCHVGTQGFIAYIEVIITKMYYYIVLYQLLSFFDNVKV